MRSWNLSVLTDTIRTKKNYSKYCLNYKKKPYRIAWSLGQSDSAPILNTGKSGKKQNGRTHKMDTTKVIFRKFKDNVDIIALFPRISENYDYSQFCSSYMHVGQHGTACVDLNGITVLAKESEYIDLKKELESIGYVLSVGKKCTKSDTIARKGQVAKWNKQLFLAEHEHWSIGTLSIRNHTQASDRRTKGG